MIDIIATASEISIIMIVVVAVSLCNDAETMRLPRPGMENTVSVTAEPAIRDAADWEERAIRERDAGGRASVRMMSPSLFPLERDPVM